MLNIKELKKTDLHCHLDGSLSATTLSHFLHRTPDFSELSVDDSCTSLTEYLKKFDLPLHCLQTKANLELAAYTFLKELAADQMKYIEVRFADVYKRQTLYSAVSNFVIGPIPTFPSLIPFQNVSTLLPIGVTAPNPVSYTHLFTMTEPQ